MAEVSIRNLDDAVRDRLRVRAAINGRSMEAEIRAILADAVRDPAEADDLFHALIDRFERLGGVELEVPQRLTTPRAADFAE